MRYIIFLKSPKILLLTKQIYLINILYGKEYHLISAEHQMLEAFLLSFYIIRAQTKQFFFSVEIFRYIFNDFIFLLQLFHQKIIIRFLRNIEQSIETKMKDLFYSRNVSLNQITEKLIFNSKKIFKQTDCEFRTIFFCCYYYILLIHETFYLQSYCLMSISSGYI